jgi:hypothetical protein
VSSDWRGDSGATDELGHDVELGDSLSLLDPASGDPNYWLRFRAWVLTNSRSELARRRLLSEITVGGVLASWARTIVPTAVIAAAIGAVVLIRTATSVAPGRITVEEILVDGIEGETIPVALGIAEGSVVTMASEEEF